MLQYKAFHKSNKTSDSNVIYYNYLLHIIVLSCDHLVIQRTVLGDSNSSLSCMYYLLCVVIGSVQCASTIYSVYRTYLW